MNKTIKRYFFLLIILFVNVLSYAQYDFLKESLKNFSTAPSYLIVKVKSPSYEGEVAIESVDFAYFYEKIKGDTLKWEYLIDSAYQDIKQGKYFIISDEDLEIKNGYFEKIIVNETVLNNSKKGIDFFIRTYFDDRGNLIPRSSQKEPYDFYTIVKVLFDAGIKSGIGCEYSFFYIQDSRFYNKRKFFIPPEYRDKGTNNTHTNPAEKTKKRK